MTEKPKNTGPQKNNKPDRAAGGKTGRSKPGFESGGKTRFSKAGSDFSRTDRKSGSSPQDSRSESGPGQKPGIPKGNRAESERGGSPDPRNSKFFGRGKGEKRPRIIRPKDLEEHQQEVSKRDGYFTKPAGKTYRESQNEREPGTRGPKSFRTGKKTSFNKTAKSEKESDGSMRLNRYIAHSGICSRRQADEFIKAGLVTVNGELVTELGVKVFPETDVVKFNNEPLRSQKLVYILLNKPKNYITTTEDPEARQTVLDLVRDACPERVFPVGRLDRNTTGVLLLTNDGDLTTRLTHPKYQVKKVYQAELDKNLKFPDLEALQKGIELEDGFIKADAVEYVDPGDKRIVGVEIHSGRNLIIRRMFEHLGYQVIKLDRVLFAGLTKKNLSRGKWRFLTEKEVAFLKMGREL